MQADSPDDYWDFQSSISGPVATLLAALSPDERATIRTTFHPRVMDHAGVGRQLQTTRLPLPASLRSIASGLHHPTRPSTSSSDDWTAEAATPSWRPTIRTPWARVRRSSGPTSTSKLSRSLTSVKPSASSQKGLTSVRQPSSRLPHQHASFARLSSAT